MTRPQDTKTIHCYDFPSFAIELEKAIKEGYSLDLHTIAHYPQQIGFQYITTVVKQDSNVVEEKQEVKQDEKKTEEVTETEPEVKPPAEPEVKKAGRPAKAK